MKIAVAQINTSVGDILGNRKKIAGNILEAEKEKCDLIVFPECTTTGYPQKDLLYNPAFIDGNTDTVLAIRDLTKELNVAVVLGFVDLVNGKLYNAATVIRDGIIEPAYHKHLLPNYNVFDERRYFEPGKEYQVYEINGIKFSIVICEDMWSDGYFENPILELWSKEKRLDFVIDISASPFSVDKEELRKEVLKKRYNESHFPILYVNQVGAQDGLIFDGGSMYITNDNGLIWQICHFFKEDFQCIEFVQNCFYRCNADFCENGYFLNPNTREIYKIQEALVLGIRDYFKKSGFEKAVIGLSGGIDSAITAALAVMALGKDNVLGVLMPSHYSSRGSIMDALDLGDKLGIATYQISIENFLASYNNNLRNLIFDGVYRSDITEQNIQARIRGNILMAISNEQKRLVLSTGNKSELSVGYTTLYGDSVGGLSVIGDVYKMNVYKLANFMNSQCGKETTWGKDYIIPQNSITKPPSAELKDDQKDTDSLPPYEILDGILKQLIERKKSFDQIVKKGYDPEIVKKITKMVARNEYKRQQMAPILIVSERDLTTGRRMPINNQYEY